MQLISETLILRYEFKGKARTRPDFFKLVLGPCAQFYPYEASEQKWGQTPKSKPKEIESKSDEKLPSYVTNFQAQKWHLAYFGSNLVCLSILI